MGSPCREYNPHVHRAVGLAVAVFLASSMIATPARADGAGVLVLDGDRGVAEAMAKAIGTERARITQDPVGDARAAIAAGAVPYATLAKLRAVRDQIAEGWKAYLTASVEFAASRLASARTEAEALIPLAGGVELYADVSLRLGIVFAHLERVDEARAVLRLALALDPERAITTAEFSPDALAAIEDAKLVRPPSQRVRVTASAQAEITVDNLAMGKGVAELDLPRGQHVIVARAPGHAPLAQAVNVDDAHSAFALRLEPHPAAERLAQFATGGELAPIVEAAMLFGELDEIVVVEPILARGGRAIVVQRCVGIPAKCSATVEIGYPDETGLPSATKEAWSTVRVGELRYTPLRRGESPGGPIVEDRCRACRSPYVWGGVAAGLVTAIVLGFVLTADKPLPVIGADPGVFGPR